MRVPFRTSQGSEVLETWVAWLGVESGPPLFCCVRVLLLVALVWIYCTIVMINLHNLHASAFLLVFFKIYSSNINFVPSISLTADPNGHPDFNTGI